MQQTNGFEDVRKLLEQHSLECRHLESERAWFMNVYALITGGILAFLAQMGLENLRELEPPWPFYFLLLFTLLGFFLTTRWTYSFECHRARVNGFIKFIWSRLPQNERPPEVCPTMTIPDFRLWKFHIIFKTRYWFPAFYLLLLIGSIFFFDAPAKWLAVGCSVVAFILFISYLCSKPE